RPCRVSISRQRSWYYLHTMVQTQ
ncbi:hypothetical protein Trydic_g11876, partial [Trypoxylus dichotomus]